LKDIFATFGRKVSRIPWGAVAGVVVEQLHAQGGVAGQVLAQLQEWAGHLAANAVREWPGTIASHAPCACPNVASGTPKKCHASAVVVCDICNRKCCLAHARIDYLAGAICEICIGEAKARARAAGPKAPGQAAPKKDVDRAFRILDLGRTATWEEIKKRHRELVFKHNADRPQTDKMRAQNTERLKKVNWALEVLRKFHEDKKEAA
jgi:hypothetical protein